MDSLYLEFPLDGRGEVLAMGLNAPAVSGPDGHLVARGAFEWPGGTVFFFGRVYTPHTEAGIRRWFSEFDPADPGAWASECDGDFAAVVHEPSKNRAWVIGDRNGQSRLYFSVQGGMLRAGNSLLSVGRRMKQPHLSQEGVFHLLALRYSLDPQTLVEDVLATTPGALVEIDGRTIRSLTYHHPVTQDCDYFTSMEDCVHGLDEAFRAGFLKRYDPSRRCVVLLSGGIDSLVMLRYLTEIAPGHVEAFTFGLKGDEQGDEVRAAQMAARHFGVPHRLSFLDPADVVRQMPASVLEADGPHYGTALWMSLQASLVEGTRPVDLYSGQDTRLHTPSFDTPMSLGIRLSGAELGSAGEWWRRALAATRVWPFRGKRTFAHWRHYASPRESVQEYLVRAILSVPAPYAVEALSRQLTPLPPGAGIQDIFKAVIEFEYRTQFTDDINSFCSVTQRPDVGVHFPFYDHDVVAACNRIPYAIGARHVFTTRSWNWIPFTQKAVLRRLLLGSAPKELVYRRKSTLPSIHLAFNSGLGELVRRVIDSWGGPLVEALDEENAVRARRVMQELSEVTTPYQFPEHHDLVWDGYSVAYLAILMQTLLRGSAALDELSAPLAYGHQQLIQPQ